VKLYGLALVKDEDDVIGDCIRHALRFCDRIFVLDNGSSDDSVAVVEDLAAAHPGRVVLWGVDPQPYRYGMRDVMYDELRAELGWDDWFLQLDADEFLLDDPRPQLGRANAGGFDLLETWQAQFQFTDVDLARWESGEEDRTLPIEQRRHHFLVDWREGRLFRNRPDRLWTGANNDRPDWAVRKPATRLVNRHYQYRDPDQIQRRIEARAKVRDDKVFRHITETDWREHLVDARHLRTWHPGETLRPWPWPYYLGKVRARVRRG